MAFVPVVQELPYCEPIEVASRFGSAPKLLFLDSATVHPDRGRYSFLSFMPVDWTSGRVGESSVNPFAILPKFNCDTIAGLPPFQGGLAGLWSYDLAHQIEKLPRPKYRDFNTPDWALGLYDWVISWDHLQKKMWVVSTGYPSVNIPEQQERAKSRLQQVLSLLKSPPSFHLTPTRFTWGKVPHYPLAGYSNISSNFDALLYQKAVQRAIDYIHAGDCFQVNLSQRLVAETFETPFGLYQKLRKVNPAPFAGFLDLGGDVSNSQILSASPERFLQVRGGQVSTRPIKGTRRKSENPEEDAKRIRDLLNSPKDRAENVMIVDLLRNDIGKSCKYGTVKVTKLCELETFQYVHHMVSEVQGTLLAEKSPVELLRGAFPGGSVTGAPKVRSMEIIAELEPTHRGAYCGSLGYVGFDGSMDTNILIRTFTKEGQALAFPVGGGIVADSQPLLEYEETLHKAAGLLQALV